MNDIRTTGSYSGNFITIRKNIYDNLIKERDALRSKLEVSINELSILRATLAYDEESRYYYRLLIVNIDHAFAEIERI